MTSLADIKHSLQKTGRFWIVFTGDSLTSCEWVHPNWREIVEYVLKKEITRELNGDWKIASWGIRTFNFGYDGATTMDILEKTDDFIELRPDLVIALMGGNDPAFHVTVAKSVNNIRAISQKVTENGARLAWSNATPSGNGFKKNEEYEPYAQALLTALPRSELVQTVDMYHLYQTFPLEKFFTFTSEAIPIEGVQAGDPDLMHPNQLGNAYIAKVLLQQIFGIDFDPEKYIQSNLAGEKYPQY